MEWLVSEIGSILVDMGKGSFKSTWGKIKLFRIKKKLNKRLFYDVLKKYGNSPFYNNLDIFLSTNKVFYNVIINCEALPIHQYKSRSQIIHYYVQLFAERYPDYAIYKTEIYSVIERCFDVIYNTLNNICLNETVRIIANISKELASELSNELKEIKDELSDIGNKINILLVQNGNETSNENNISLEQYFEFLTRLYLDKKENVKFIPRYLYFKDEEDKNVDAFEALLKDRNILLLGEAGYGKTYESIDLLSKLCTDPRANGLLPFYLPLDEYGTIYSNIMEGIQYKIKPFCQGSSEYIVRRWLASGQVVLILDGIDDIETTEKRKKFIAEVKNIALHYDQSYLFITSRFNRYHGN